MDNYFPINLAYDLFESSQGSDPNLTPIIFTHGLASDRRTWKNFAPIIAEKTRRKVYAYDARNYGDSDYTEEYNFSLNVDDLFHFMNTINAQKAVLFGHSMGAYTVTNAALQKPERIEMVISEDTFVKNVTDKVVLISRDYLQELANSFLNIPSHLNEEEATKKIVDDMFAELSEDNKKWTPKNILYKLHIPFKRDSEGRYMANFNEEALYQAYSDPVSLKMETVGLYEGPAVFLSGSNSVMDVRSHMPHISGFFPNAELIDFEGGYHSLHVQFKEELVDTVIQVLDKYNIS